MLFLDVETKHLYFETPEIKNTSDLEVSFVGVYDSAKDKYISIWEKDLATLQKMMKEAEKIVGYNLLAFDYAALQPYMDVNLWGLPTLDLMVAMKVAIGFRPKLDDLARANLGTTKLGKGTDAVDYWRKGELKKLEEYCLEDVRLTYEIWKLGNKEKRIKYFDKSGFIKEVEIDWDRGFSKKEEQVQTTMF